MVGANAGVMGNSSRLDALHAELAMALSGTDKTALKDWARRSALRIPKGVGHRSLRLGGLLLRAGKWVAIETKDGVVAGARGRFKDHAAARGHAAVATSKEVARDVANFGKELAGITGQLATNPEEAAPKMLGLGLGFLAGSGGIDGDGGIPDLDFLGGIGAHRSIFTHSIIAGAVAEALIASALELVVLVHARLPAKHDPLWDGLAAFAVRTGTAARVGIDLGLATHLAIDGTIDGMTPYKDLPGYLPMEAHRAILLSNAAAEAAVGIDGAKELAKKKKKKK